MNCIYSGTLSYCVRTLKQELNKLVSLLLISKVRTKAFKTKQVQAQTVGSSDARLNLLNNLLRRLTLKGNTTWHIQ